MERGIRIVVRAGFGIMLAIVGIAAVNTAFGLGENELIRTWAPAVVYVLAAPMVGLRSIASREHRLAWSLLGGGLLLYCLGNLLWSFWLEELDPPPIPSIADALWLSLYPASYAGLILLARGPGRTPPAAWVDGIVAGLGVAALAGAVVLRPVREAASGSTAAVVTNLAYPLADMLLAGLMMGILALRGWRLDTRWASIGAGFLGLAVADLLYLLQVAKGVPEAGLVPNLFYMSGVALLALGAWRPAGAKPPGRLDGWSTLLVPGAFALSAVGLLVYDHLARLGLISFSLAILTIVAALVRTALSFRDLRTLAQTRLEATTDELTSLPNRRVFMRAADERVAAARARGEQLALLIIDLDGFKELNDTLGHLAGDELLRQLGPRLGSSVRPGDLLARLGGDEFGLLLGPPAGREPALETAARLRAVAREPFEMQGVRARVGASVGIALFPDDAHDSASLLRHADAAMYRAKLAGGGAEVYTPEADDEEAGEALELAAELPGAIAGGELELHFQPIAMTDGCIVGLEALVRWGHPERGLIPPSSFIGLAEQSGVMRDLTRWILDTALARAGHWREQGHRLRLSVNVSVPDLLDIGFPGEVAAALERHGVGPSGLVIEVTESTIMSDPVRICEVLSRLGELGVDVSLDDFGTGYSSLLHLKTLPVRELKIDRGFVAGLGVERADRAIVRSTVQLAHDLGLRVVAEGVEDEPTLRELAVLGCELVQGYYLARPLPAQEVEEFLAAAAGRRAPYTNLLNPAL